MENTETANIENMKNMENMTPAERMYRNHLRNVKKYQQKNPEKVREKNKRFNDKLKNEKPDEYKEMLLNKKRYYEEVRKPRIQHLRELKKINEALDEKEKKDNEQK